MKADKTMHAVLRKLLDSAKKVAPKRFPWNADQLYIVDPQNQEIAGLEHKAWTALVVSAINALPAILDEVDLADDRERALKDVISELEAARWRPIEGAPKDGKDWLIVAAAGTPFRGPAYWCDGRWCQGTHEEPLHFKPTHFCEMPEFAQ